MKKHFTKTLIPGKPIIVYGPHGCGKTTHAKALAAYFEKETIIDSWGGASDCEATKDALYLTSEDMSLSGFRYTIPFYVAAKLAGIDISNHIGTKHHPRRYCKDCIYCEGNLKWGPECTAPESRRYDLVTGPKNLDCRRMRTNERFCGSEGFFYVFKIVAEPVKSLSDAC